MARFTHAGPIALAGRTRAGKTTLARELGIRLDCRQTSFSSYVRATATDRGLDEKRRTLQDLGAEMIATSGPRAFVNGALGQAGLSMDDSPFVIEGVRHIATFEALKEIAAPRPLALIYLDVSDGQRDRRLAEEGVSPAEGRRWEEHSTEYDVLHRLKEAADLVIDADRPRDFVANTAVDWLFDE